MKQQYQNLVFKRLARALIDVMNVIVDEYAEAGFTLTVRQLFYQLVARAVIQNTEKSYKHVCRTVNNGKLAGLIDWDAIEDRTRAFKSRPRWSSIKHLMTNAASQYHVDLWKNQDCRVYVVVEKEALYGVFAPVCQTFDMPLLAARGYPSGTVLREFAQNYMLPNWQQECVILHFGDHDPSGIDMSRDLEERLRLFGERPSMTFKRIALNMAQIEEFNPPKNPAKMSDSRALNYVRQYGHSSWELDALDPRYLQSLVEKEIQPYIDITEWNKRHEIVKNGKNRIKLLAHLFT